MSDYDPDFDVMGCYQRIGLAMRVLGGEEENLGKILATTSMAHTIGPFIDPTKYRDQLYRGDMDAMADLARALRDPVRIWNERIAPKITDGVAA